ncbi:hypothetical protein [Cellulomonas sp. RIT-PI-Y]|uniref:hypothetical protein n=1 Tax=Cellulomonas sp. RIT-PI-Y TaxID=3035297 RepID=UPI0021D88E85|nr:hypothetical protein [Cellulomonas sp. RIT-PI-Y]
MSLAQLATVAHDAGDPAELVAWRPELEAFARRRLAGACASSRAVRAGVGDLDAAACDVVGEVLVTLWSNRVRWADVRDARAWAFGVTRIQVARCVRAARARAALEVPLADGEAERLPDPETRPRGSDTTVGPDWSGPLWQVRAQVVDRLGAEAWDRVCVIVLGPAHGRCRALRTLLVSQLAAVSAGGRVDVPRIARTAQISAGMWAAGRRCADRDLNPAHAVRDGVCADTTRARRDLAVWWATGQPHEGTDIDAGVLREVGLVDDHPVPQRAGAARALAAWLSWTHPELVPNSADATDPLENRRPG